jgi:hypothetical protein
MSLENRNLPPQVATRAFATGSKADRMNRSAPLRIAHDPRARVSLALWPSCNSFHHASEGDRNAD